MIHDLYDWKNEGVALPTVAENPDHDLACENVIERAKVIYNAKTKKFVMWLHQDGPDYQTVRAGVAVSDTPTAGRFSMISGMESIFRVDGKSYIGGSGYSSTPGLPSINQWSSYCPQEWQN